MRCGIEGKTIKVVFPNDYNDMHFINAFSIVKGNDDYFIRLGYAIPPSLSREEIEQIEKIEAKTLFTLAMTKSTMKEFIRIIQKEYEEDEE